MDAATEDNVLYCAPTARFASFEGMVVALDLTSEECFAFDDLASSFWQALLTHGGNRERAAASLDLHRRAAFRAFLDACLQRSLLSVVAPPVASDAVSIRETPRAHDYGRSFLTPRAWWYLISTWWLLRTRGFGTTYLACVTQPSRAIEVDVVIEDRLVKAFVRAENLFWFRGEPNDCVPRSLALFRFLRALGVPAVHRIGAARYPAFLMHAWVECRGRPLLDDPETIERFTVLSAIA